MRSIYLPFFLAVEFAVPAQAQNAEIQSAIMQQIDAFRADDMELAFSLITPQAQTMFGTPEIFGQLVKDGYPMVYRPTKVEMLELRDDSGTLWQRIRVVDTEGVAWLVDFMMVETQKGWRMNTVMLLPSNDTGD